MIINNYIWGDKNIYKAIYEETKILEIRNKFQNEK
jgi:hypothetical protein